MTNGQAAAYLAGLIDGEGSVVIQRRADGSIKSRQITIVNTDFDLITAAMECYEQLGIRAGVCRGRDRAGCKPKWSVYVGNRRGIDMIHRLVPLRSSEKKAKLEIAATTWCRQGWGEHALKAQGLSEVRR